MNNIKIDPEAAKRAEATRNKLADLADVWTTRDAEHCAAVAELERIKAAWRSGDDGPTAQDHNLAELGLTRAEALLDAAGRKLGAEDRRRKALNFDLAIEVAQRVADLYGGVRTVVTDKLPDELPKVGHGAILYVIQSCREWDEGYGLLALDSLTLALYGRSRIISAPPVGDFDKLFADAGWKVETTRDNPEQVEVNVWKSFIHLKIERAWLSVPWIDLGAEVHCHHSGNRVGAPGLTTLVDMVGGSLAQVAASARVAITHFATSSAVAKVTTNADGITTERLTLGFAFSVDSGGWRVTGSQLCDLALAGLVGQLVPGLGVCTEAVDAKPTEGRAWTFTLVRRQPEPEESAEGDDHWESDDYADDEPGALPAFTDRSLEAAYDESR